MGEANGESLDAQREGHANIEALEKLIMSALVIQVLNAILSVILIVSLLSPLAVPYALGRGPPAWPIFVLVYGLVAVLLVPMTYGLVYRRLRDRRIAGLSRTMVALGVLSLTFGGFVSGIVLLAGAAKVKADLAGLAVSS